MKQPFIKEQGPIRIGDDFYNPHSGQLHVAGSHTDFKTIHDNGCFKVKLISKKEYIESKGWVTLWNEDNWVHYDIMAGASIDHCGLNLQTAYEAQLKYEQKQ